ncbi:nucleotidyl transferase AbiEii/AbiGii toxin family protein [bacterium]|nr:nucleotidyl transferase AbiEii/AbiGii toxin family protein [bacterium]
MDRRCLTAGALRLFRNLAPIARRHGAVLAGGTALAIRLAHRFSFDFDFFTPEKVNARRILAEVGKLGLDPEIELARDDTFIVTFPGSKFSLFRYPYPFIHTDVFEGVKVAGVLDIASMKAAAISQRGAKRDFVDLYFILQNIPFGKIAETIKSRYGTALSTVAVGKSLVYFDDAEASPDPVYIGAGVKWETIKRFFEKHVRQFVLDLEAAYSDAESPAGQTVKPSRRV